MYSYFRFCFRHIQINSRIIQEHTHAYLVPSVSLAYSEPWHILITKHIQTPRYIHNTILNIFTKAPSWTFDKVLNAPLSLKDAILYSFFNIIFQTYSNISRFIQPYLCLLRHIKNASMLKNILLQRYSGVFETLHIIFRQIRRYLGHRLI